MDDKQFKEFFFKLTFAILSGSLLIAFVLDLFIDVKISDYFSAIEFNSYALLFMWFLLKQLRRVNSEERYTIKLLPYSVGTFIICMFILYIFYIRATAVLS